MEAPHSNPVGLPVVPRCFDQSPRTHGPARRLLALALLGIFLAVASFTTAASLGAYCLTSDGANTGALPR